MLRLDRQTQRASWMSKPCSPVVLGPVPTPDPCDGDSRPACAPRDLWTANGGSTVRVVRAARCFALVALCTMGCDSLAAAPSLNEACRTLGLCDIPTLPPGVTDVLCDASTGSSCDRDTLTKTLDPVLRQAAERPGSSVRLWVLKKTMAETVMLAECETKAIPQGSERARTASIARTVASGLEYFMAAAASALSEPAIRRSPLAEAIAKIALFDARGLPRRIVVITDGREVSALGDFECHLLPSDAGFVRRLQNRRILGPGVLTGTRVEFVFVQTSKASPRGCPATLDRELRIRELWRAALKASGTSTVDIRTGPPVMSDGEAGLKTTAERKYTP
jgi:hypothetical protein